MSEPHIGVLDQRVTGLEHGFKDLSTALNHMGSRIDDRFGSLATLINERGRTQWPLLYSAAGLIISVMSIIGILAMRPTDYKISDLYDSVKELRATEVPRAEIAERWRSYDKDIENVRGRLLYETSTLEKSIDDLRKKFNDTYGARDVILDLRERLARLEIEYAKKQ